MAETKIVGYKIIEYLSKMALLPFLIMFFTATIDAKLPAAKAKKNVNWWFKNANTKTGKNHIKCFFDTPHFSKKLFPEKLACFDSSNFQKTIILNILWKINVKFFKIIHV